MGPPHQRPAEGREGGFSARGPRARGPACGPSSWAARGTVSFSFSFCAKFILCLILYNKSCADPKIMEIFV